MIILCSKCLILKYFSYLCIVNQNPFSMDFKIRTYGRTELAQLFFPKLHSQSAWQKLRSWLQLNPQLRPLAAIRRRTFTPAEVRQIVDMLGEP